MVNSNCFLTTPKSISIAQTTHIFNDVNSKSKEQEVLFRISSNSNYREVDIRIYNPQNILLSFFV